MEGMYLMHVTSKTQRSRTLLTDNSDKSNYLELTDQVAM